MSAQGSAEQAMSTARDRLKKAGEAPSWLVTSEGERREEKLPVQGQIAIKGTRHGLLLTLEPDTPFSELLQALAERLAEAPDFFRGATLTVDTRQRVLQASERVQLENLLAHYRMSIVSLEQVAGMRRGSLSEGARLGLGLNGGPAYAAAGPYAPYSPYEKTGAGAVTVDLGLTAGQRDPRESDDTLFLRRTVRSGQAIHHHSNIVVLGDVNPGAEVVAGGDVIVWGVLRGMVHAGYPDNEQALVCALLLAPVQLRIAHLLSRPPEGLEVQPRPEVASIRQGQIVVETWLNGRPPRK
ncbi:septum site-determining protein MinC [Thermogemmatispora carboxidivorans]|uniref:septum site-determining protein MinC n=1 Tax=Thermogemmatispora carboxidivorans TaxID=1382306 RepID=UPI000A6AB3B2|nr:septum site-determining protein MinC [Thermogemmatispora carboxidivorans]